MEITEAKIKMMPSRSDRLQAFCTITIDNDFVIRDIKIIEGAKGAFVAMPSRKLTDKCPKCGGKNHLRARHCNDCGGQLKEDRAANDKRGRAKLHADIAHPINSSCRENIQGIILKAYDEELERAKEPGYVPTMLYDDDMDEFHDFDRHDDHRHKPAEAPAPEQPEEAAPAAVEVDDEEEAAPAVVEVDEEEEAAPAAAEVDDDKDADDEKDEGGFSAGIL